MLSVICAVAIILNVVMLTVVAHYQERWYLELVELFNYAKIA